MRNPEIRLFEPTFRIDECVAAYRECLEVGWTGLGFKTVEFENAWKAYTGFSNAHFLNSATAGLRLAIRILKERRGWADGDEIISTPITFVATNHAILLEGMRVVFADIDDYGCLDPGSVERCLGQRTRAVMFVGLGGNVGQLDAIEGLCQAYGLALILDAAHMAGTQWRNATPGLCADATVFSFHAVKNLPTGDAGMLCFRDPVFDKIARRLSWLGIDRDTFERANAEGGYEWRYEVDTLAGKDHGNSLMAATALAQLPFLDEDNEYRRRVCSWYDEILQDMEERLDVGPVGLRRVKTAPGCRSSRHLYQIMVPRRDQVIAALRRRGVATGVHYRDNSDYPMYSDQAGRCPRAAAFARRALSLPLHLKLDRADVANVCGALRESLFATARREAAAL